MVNLNKEPTIFEIIFRGVTNKKTPSEIDNDIDKADGERGEAISVSNVSLKNSGKLVLVSSLKLDKEVTCMREVARKSQ